MAVLNMADRSASTPLHQAHFCTIHGPVEPWFRQTPNADGVFGRTRFCADRADDRNMWLVVCDEVPEELTTNIAPERRILFVGEPPDIKVYPPRYLNQFGRVVSPMPLPGYRGIHIRHHGALPWHYGRNRPFSWADYAADKPKSQVLSVFCSSKIFTRQQEVRIRFVDRLKSEFGALVQHFGSGINPIDEKSDGLDPFRYTVVLENNRVDGFWTEKLADAYLGHCFPIYSGGRIPNPDFDANARVDIDTGDMDEAIHRIVGAIREGRFEHAEPLLREQRRLVMERHNFFAVADRIISAADDDGKLLHRPVALRSSGWRWNGPGTVRRWLRSAIGR